jgi:hypothetical protein
VTTTDQEGKYVKGEMRVASLNMFYGGLDSGGSDTRWRKQMEHLATWDPDVVLLQEMAAPTAAGLPEHLWRTANELGMMPVLGPPTPHTTGRTYPAVMVRRADGWRIVNSGPPLWEPGGGAFPAWCQVTVQMPDMPRPVAFYSVHFPARSAQWQLGQAQQLASVVAQRGEIAVAGGDWNCLARGDLVTQAELEAMPMHLRPPRMRAIRAGKGSVLLGEGSSILLEPIYDVHDVLCGIGLTDVAAWLPSGRREPAKLSATAGDGRPDRFYTSEEVAETVVRYAQASTGATDHDSLMIVIDTDAAAAITPLGAAA